MRPGARQLLGAATLLLSALVLPGVASAQYYRPSYPPLSHRGYGPQSMADGFVTQGNGSCLMLRDHQRRPYYLSGNTDGLEPGDHVAVRARTLGRSACGDNGPTLEVLAVQTVWTGGSHRSAYFDARRDGNFARFLASNRDRGGWYSDHYSYLTQNGDRYGQYAPPNGPGDRYGQPQYPPPGQPQYQGQYQGQPQYQEPPQGPPDQGPPPDYDQNGPGQPPPPQYEPQEGPNGSYDQNGQSDQSAQQPVTVDGTLDFNGPCPSVRDRGVSYDLAGDLRGFHNGERVHVTGLLSGSSSCGGTALEIQEIRQRR